MVQVSKRSWSGKIKSCYVDHMLRELAIEKAKEINFLLVWSKDDANCAPKISSSTCRIAFHEYDNTKSPSGLVGPNLRTLIFFGESLQNYNELRMVRVLHLQYDQIIRDDPEWLKQLTTLRYFQSNAGYVDFEGAKKKNLPTSFWNNKMLRYVKTRDYLMGPPSLANLENLETLKFVITRNEWTVKLPHFPRIRKLGIMVNSNTNWKGLTNAMSKLEHLQSLAVAGYRLPWLTSAFKNYEQMHSLRLDCSWLRDVLFDSSLLPPYLVKLTLSWSSLEKDPMPKLGQLHNLRVLRMLEYSYNGERLICSTGRFLCLQQLKLVTLRNLVELKVEEGSMPELNLLEIGNCPKLEILPDFQFLTNLRELSLYGISDELCSRLKGADQHKVKHIQSITFEKMY